MGKAGRNAQNGRPFRYQSALVQLAERLNQRYAETATSQLSGQRRSARSESALGSGEWPKRRHLFRTGDNATVAYYLALLPGHGRLRRSGEGLCVEVGGRYKQRACPRDRTNSRGRLRAATRTTLETVTPCLAPLAARCHPAKSPLHSTRSTSVGRSLVRFVAHTQYNSGAIKTRRMRGTAGNTIRSR